MISTQTIVPKLAQLRWLLRGKVGRDPTAAPDAEVLRSGLEKTEVVLLLARRLGLFRYLELCSKLSGNFYDLLHGEGSLTTRRLMYRSSRFQSDGLPVDWRSPSDDIAAPLAEMARDGYRPEICLIDSWHTYETSLRDIQAAFDLLPDGGVLVIHDCLPPSPDMATPTPGSGCWCGWSYRAFIDFAWSTPGLTHFTIDCDYGCGVIVKGGAETALPAGLVPPVDPEERIAVLAGWRALGDDSDAAYAYLQAHKAVLLRLIPAAAFRAAFAEPGLMLDRFPEHQAADMLRGRRAKA